MDKAIREGALRLLTNETSCDVIISCRGCRLMAHKVILSIASPLLQDILRQDTTEPTVLIFPDINGNVMSLILDYIYTGSVTIYSNTIDDFISAANLLKLHLDLEYLENYFSRNWNVQNYSFNENVQNICHNINCPENERQIDPNDYSKESCSSMDNVKIPSSKTNKKMPHLMPITSVQNKIFRTKKGLYNRVFPSPWCPRVAPLLADPRIDCITNTPSVQIAQEKLEENDTNNNFQVLPALPVKTSYFNENLLKTELTTNIYLNKLPTTSIESPDGADLKHTFPSKSPKLLNKIETDKIQVEEKPLGVTASSGISHETVLKTENSVTKDVVKIKSTSNVDEKSDNGRGEQKNEKQKPFKCEDCGKSFSQLRNYKYHRSVHEGTKEFAARCPECGKVFNDRGYLSSHLKIHRDRKEYACPHCPKRFNQRVAYNMHLRIHTGIKPHECPTCGKSFSRKMLLKQHQRVHTGERPYSCPECGKSFADRSNMSLHARLHTGVKPYACSLCPKSFTKKHHLKTHMNFHTGLKPYSCQNCGLAFSQSSNMRTHYKKCILKMSTTDETTQSTSS